MDLFAALPPLRWLIYESRVPTRHIAIAGLCFAGALALQATFSKPPKCDKHCRHEEKRPRANCCCCSRAGQPLPATQGHDHVQPEQQPKKDVSSGFVKETHHREPRKRHHDIGPRAEPNKHRNKYKQPEPRHQFQPPPVPAVPDIMPQPPPVRRQPLPSLPRYPPPPGCKQRLLPPGTPYQVNHRPPLTEDSHLSPFQKSALNAHPNQNLNVLQDVPSRFQLQGPFLPWAGDESNPSIPTIRPGDRTLNSGYINPFSQAPKPNDLGHAGPLPGPSLLLGTSNQNLGMGGQHFGFEQASTSGSGPVAPVQLLPPSMVDLMASNSWPPSPYVAPGEYHWQPRA